MKVPSASTTGKMKEFVQIFRQEILIAILIIFYTVGTVGILLDDTKEQFLPLSFFNLLLSFTLLILGRKSFNGQLIVFIFFCYIVGYSVEAIGVHTGLLFGDYAYGKNLGLKIMGIPLIIGVNWAMLVFTSGAFFAHLKQANWLKAMISAGLMTALDAIMEPVAIKSDFWQWEGGVIPFYNYVCWFFISWALLWIGFKLKLIESNKVSKALFILLTVFFTILNW